MDFEDMDIDCDPNDCLNPWIIAVLGFLIIISLIFGTILHGAGILYERYGGDPQKRGLTNQVTQKETTTRTLTNHI